MYTCECSRCAHLLMCMHVIVFFQVFSSAFVIMCAPARVCVCVCVYLCTYRYNVHTCILDPHLCMHTVTHTYTYMYRERGVCVCERGRFFVRVCVRVVRCRQEGSLFWGEFATVFLPLAFLHSIPLAPSPDPFHALCAFLILYRLLFAPPIYLSHSCSC